MGGTPSVCRLADGEMAVSASRRETGKMMKNSLRVTIPRCYQSVSWPAAVCRGFDAFEAAKLLLRCAREERTFAGVLSRGDDNQDYDGRRKGNQNIRDLLVGQSARSHVVLNFVALGCQAREFFIAQKAEGL